MTTDPRVEAAVEALLAAKPGMFGNGAAYRMARAALAAADAVDPVRVRESALRAALAALVQRLDEVHASAEYADVWRTFQNVTGTTYAGPTYTDVVEAARSLLEAE